MVRNPSICVIGLGYVGLPLAISFAKAFRVIGFDINKHRIEDLKNGNDNTKEVSGELLLSRKVHYTNSTEEIKEADIYVITVPTPITQDYKPDLGLLETASEMVGKVLSKGNIVVYESTVYPGVTEEICGKILEKFSGMTSGKDFFLGYSPERMNPGDKIHSVESITKVIAAQNEESLKVLEDIYGIVTGKNLFIAKDIRTAEAAKVIENAQRDINVAFINEVASVFSEMGISIYDVLDAAKTKWNFLNFTPGLVGGHCIGVDPYYLVHVAEKNGIDPQVILAGRSINEKMGPYIAKRLIEKAKENQGELPLRVLILGLTFKEQIPDIRNSKVFDLIEMFKGTGAAVDVHDPFACPNLAFKEYGLPILRTLEGASGYDICVLAVSHEEYKNLSVEAYKNFLNEKGLLADIKGCLRPVKEKFGDQYWSL